MTIESADKTFRNRLPQFLLAGFVIVVLGGIGIYAALTAGLQETDDAQIDADVINLGVRIGGQVSQVYVADNQAVKAGDVILEIDPAPQKAIVLQAEAELHTAQAQEQAAKAQVDVVEASASGGLQSARASLSGSSLAVSTAIAQIAAAKAGLERAQADAQKADLDLKRATALQKSGAIAQEKLDYARIAQEQTQAALEQAKANEQAAIHTREAALSHVSEAQGRLRINTPIAAQIVAAQANLKVATAKVDAALARLNWEKLQFDYLQLRSPINGTVSKLSAHQGALLQAGQAVAELVPQLRYVTANFKETQIGCMRIGLPTEVVIDAFAKHTLHGEVESISEGTGARFSLLPPDNASGNFVKVVQRVPVKIKLLNIPATLDLRVGLSADVTVSCRD